jgi:hypothetical protein
MYDLKPCPFCGGEAILETVDGNSPEECYIYCTRRNLEGMKMAECIEREALITKFKKMGLGEHGLVERLFADGVYAVIAAFPAADVAPVVHGRWEPCFDKNCRCRWGFGKCSNCGQEYYAHAIDHYKYCPICGAKMDGGNS